MARQLAKAEGVDESEVGADEHETQVNDKGRITLDHGSSARRWDMQPERTRGPDRGLTDDEWGDGFEGKG